MIYTVTFNPSLDYIIRVDNLELGKINRVNYENILPGGKGINVSIALGNLGHKSVALGFTAGFTGREIEARMREYGADCDFIDAAILESTYWHHYDYNQQQKPASHPNQLYP